MAKINKEITVDDQNVLKDLEDVIVSNVEPTGENRKKIWIQQGKNILNLKSCYRVPTGTVLSQGTNDVTLRRKCISISIYTIQEILRSRNLFIPKKDSIH